MGATHVIYDENLSAAIVRLTDAQRFAGRKGAELLIGGFDVVYDTLGSPSTLQNALRWTREGGAAVLLGARPTPLSVDLTPIWNREVDLIGAWMHGTENAPGASIPSALGRQRGGRESPFQMAARLIRERKMTPDRLVTHRFPLREVRRALETARAEAENRTIKVMLDMRDPTGLDAPTAEALAGEARG
jgi:threonine dehydrogenase-like Zn-dependent dehydrogenase